MAFRAGLTFAFRRIRASDVGHDSRQESTTQGGLRRPRALPIRAPCQARHDPWHSTLSWAGRRRAPLQGPLPQHADVDADAAHHPDHDLRPLTHHGTGASLPGSRRETAKPASRHTKSRAVERSTTGATPETTKLPTGSPPAGSFEKPKRVVQGTTPWCARGELNPHALAGTRT